MTTNSNPHGKILIICNSQSRFCDQLESLNSNDLLDFEFLKIAQNNLHLANQLNLDFIKEKKINAILDLTVSTFEKKKSLLENISNLSKSNTNKNFTIISDLSFFNLKCFDFSHLNINSVVAFNCWSPKNTYEVFTFNKCENLERSFSKIKKLLNVSIYQIKEIELAFSYPIIIAMIINEAFFSLEENLASESDIDLAMKYGLNYPLGPFEWTKKIGKKNIEMILDQYLKISKKITQKNNLKYFNSNRYTCSKLLQKGKNYE